jgi:chromosome segregation ATPase
MDDSFDRLEQKVKEAAARVKQLKRDNERLSGEAESARADLEKASARIAALEGEQGAAAESAAESEGLRAELAQSKDRIAELEEATTADPGGADSELSELKSELETAREALSTAEARVSELAAGAAEPSDAGELEELEQTVSRLREERKEIKKRVKKLVGALDSL